MKVVDVRIVSDNAILKPLQTFERCWKTLWILKCSTLIYELKEDLIFEIDFLNGDTLITEKIKILKGYNTNLASVPAIFQHIYPADGVYRELSILHDAIYGAQLYPREICDEIFNVGLEKVVSKTVRLTFYYGVKAFGWISYNNLFIKDKEELIKLNEQFIEIS